jgi:p-aminobenzoyl-glutamate transporter AbgT
MNKKRAYYYPVSIYLLVLLMVWIGSFFVDVAQMLSGGSHVNSSLLSAGGIRWAVRNALPAINALPWGIFMLSVVMLGLSRGSGLANALSRLARFRRLSGAEVRAFAFSLALMVCYLLLLYMSTSSPWNLLSGVSEDSSLSPIVQGRVILLFFGVLLMSLIYGYIYGNYRSVMDVFTSTADLFKFYVPAFMALIPASGIVPCLQYAGVDSIIGLPWGVINVTLYLLPFIYQMILGHIRK